jgi:hypothetical protein
MSFHQSRYWVAACLAGLAALWALPVHAATHFVTNCADTGAGSLRAAVAAASDGDLVDLRTLGCRRIVLTSGPIDVPQASLVVRGAGIDRLAISGNYASSVFRHSGAGKLTLRGMAIERGEHHAPGAQGGCMYSAGDVALLEVRVRDCGAFPTGGTFATGGGLHVEGNLAVHNSTLHFNRAHSHFSSGGAAFVRGHLRAHRTRMTGNIADYGGAFRVENGVTLTYVTVAENHARRSRGGMQVLALQESPSHIAHSTISGNTAVEQTGAFSLPVNTSIENTTISGNRAPFISIGYLGGQSSIVNSTIAYNITDAAFEGNCSPGALLTWSDVHIESSILARNTCIGEFGFDITGPPPSGVDPPPPPIVIGADNVIERYFHLTSVPADTITGVDPLLGPLTNNGGPTLTHMPGANSIAIGRGNNVHGLEFDQRGEGYPRIKGTRTDIGAVER